MQPRFIILDNDPDSAAFLYRCLASAGFNEVQIERDLQKAILLFESRTRFDIVLIDANLLKGDGQELLVAVKKANPSTECIVVAAMQDAAIAVQCLRQGAYDYLTKPFSPDQIRSMLRRALERKRLLDVVQAERGIEPPALSNPEAFKKIITGSQVFLRVLRAAELLAASDAPILISGERGTGKSLLAKAIHDASLFSDFPYLALDAASVEGNALEKAMDGPATVFLDAIENLSPAMQGELLRAIQNSGLPLIESGRLENSGMRLVGSTNANIESMMQAGKFRPDLFRHFRGSWLHLPPLRRRPEDIPALSHYFLKEWGKSGEAFRLEAAAIAALTAYEFPGNVDELQAALREAIAQTQGRVISVECLPDHIQTSVSTLAGPLPARGAPMSLAELEKAYILNLYRQLNHNKVRTARALGVGLNTVRRKLKAYGVK